MLGEARDVLVWLSMSAVAALVACALGTIAEGLRGRFRDDTRGR
jgi:hypothetical protein